MNKNSTVAPCSMLLAVTLITACGGNGSDNQPPPPVIPAAPSVTVDAGLKQLIFNWAAVPGASSYRLLENADGDSGFTQVGEDLPAGAVSVSRQIAVHLYDFATALYIVQACNATGCTASAEVNAMNDVLDTIGYFKTSDTENGYNYGTPAIALSGDAKTLVVGVANEDSGANGTNGDQDDDSADATGAVYVFRQEGGDWRQQAFLRASNAESGDRFGSAVAISESGNTLVVGATGEDSAAVGLDGDQDDNSSRISGAVYVFEFDGLAWNQEHYIKATVTDGYDEHFLENGFGYSVALDSAGDVLVVGAPWESSTGFGVNPCPCPFYAYARGAVYVLNRTGSTWVHDAFIKGGATYAGGFGLTTALSADGSTLAASALPWYSTASTNVYRNDGTGWVEEALLTEVRLDRNRPSTEFGRSVSLDENGTTLAIGAPWDQSDSTEINGDRSYSSRVGVGAVHLFRFDGSAWNEQAYIKPSTISGGVPTHNGFPEARLGWSVSLSSDGNILAAGAVGQNSGNSGVNADQDDHSAPYAGAVFLFEFDGSDWTQAAFIKASNAEERDAFGISVALDDHGQTLAVGASGEDSGAAGINGDQDDNSAEGSGAVYVY